MERVILWVAIEFFGTKLSSPGRNGVVRDKVEFSRKKSSYLGINLVLRYKIVPLYYSRIKNRLTN